MGFCMVVLVIIRHSLMAGICNLTNSDAPRPITPLIPSNGFQGGHGDSGWVLKLIPPLHRCPQVVYVSSTIHSQARVPQNCGITNIFCVFCTLTWNKGR